MAVSCVHLEADAYMVCLTHALSTEREEVMGLLIGEVDEKRISHISAVIMLRRSDKQPDRVEISPEQLSDASTRAEDLARELQRPLRVLGWYHSHPHITVWPSHVDVRTQAMYQMMDEGFIGLIFSVFNEEKNTKQNRMQVTCFQSVEHGKACLESLVELPRILCQEEDEAYNKTLEKKDLDLITRMHNSSVYTKSLCQIMEVMSGPLIQTLENRLQSNKEKIQMLEEEKKRLQKQIEST
ncbi:hypothetical protein KUTeg_012501 [Tegillarca granosa]|uniref:MPN domain-containing protein n=1 Tax=Tegillarca granosa TaxID=220873 RepID=A0ABQ9F262_TEGGR|nr:hypothetical protein KUTeg_012501 [Tegillarca granosa]